MNIGGDVWVDNIVWLGWDVWVDGWGDPPALMKILSDPIPQPCVINTTVQVFR